MKKRYNLVVTKKMFGELQKEARRRGMTIAQLLRWCIRIGLVAMKDPARDTEII